MAVAANLAGPADMLLNVWSSLVETKVSMTFAVTYVDE